MVVGLAFEWVDVLFANWRVDAGVLADHLPEAFSPETFDGSGWLSAVPFSNVDVRPRGVPARAGVRLPELNLRTYVTCGGDSGVYFFSLDAQGVLAVLGARLFHHLPYYYARIRHRRSGGRVAFESRRSHPGARPAAFAASYRPTGPAFTAEPGTLADFLTERRRLFTQAPDGSLRYTVVEHDRWRLRPATASIRENTLLAANGFAEPDGSPVLYFCPRVDVVTTASRRW